MAGRLNRADDSGTGDIVFDQIRSTRRRHTNGVLLICEHHLPISLRSCSARAGDCGADGNIRFQTRKEVNPPQLHTDTILDEPWRHYCTS